MRLPEQNLWDRMRRNLNPVKGLLLQRIENRVHDGDPDVRSIRAGLVRYIELKVAREGIPKRKASQLLGNDDGLRQDQKNWLVEWAAHGGTAYVVIGIAGSPLHIAMKGALADEINKASLSWLLEHAECSGNSPEFWKEFEKLL